MQIAFGIVSLFLNGSAQRYETAQTPAQNYQLGGVGGGMAFRFADPLFKTSLLWNINLSYTQQWWTYDAPDVTVDPNTVRQQIDGSEVVDASACPTDPL